MATYIDIQSNYTQDPLVLVNASVSTGYSVLRGGTNFGDAIETPLFSRTIDSTSVRVTGARLDAREQQIDILVTSTTVAGLQNLIDELFNVVNEINHKGGGKIRYRSDSGTYVNTFNVGFATISGTGNLSEYEAFFRQHITLALIVDTYGLSHSFDIVDTFDYKTTTTEGRFNLGGSDWEIFGASGGALTNMSISGGALYGTANLSTNNVMAHTGTPNLYGDNEIIIELTTGSTATTIIQAWPKVKIDPTSRVGIKCEFNQNTGTLYIDKVFEGTTTLASTAITVSALTKYWFVARIENGVVYAEQWDTKPTPNGTPTASTSTVLTDDLIRHFGRDCRSRVAIGFQPGTAYSRIHEVSIKANSYKNWVLPSEIPLNNKYGGNIDAKSGVYYTTSGGTNPVWMMYGWYPRPSSYNLVWNGGAESVGTTSTVAYGWVATAVSGVIGAATSITRTTTAASIRTGSASFEVITPATTDTGASFIIYKKFKKGVTYTAYCFARSAASSTLTRIKLGISGDVSTEISSALSSDFRLHSVSWTPAADTDFAYFAIGVNAATATTFQFDDVVVYENSDLNNIYSVNNSIDPIFDVPLNEETFGESAIDSIQGLIGTMNGNPTYGKLGPIPGSTNTSIDFDGTGDYFSFPYNANINANLNVTLEAWVRRDTDTGGIEYIIGNSPSVGNGFGLYINSSDQLVTEFGGTLSSGSTDTLSTATWYHVVSTFNSGVTSVYINGRLANFGTGTSYTPRSSGSLHIGASTTPDSYFNGKIANVRIYNRALSDVEILNRYSGAESYLSGAIGPGIVNASLYDQAKASVSTDGSYWTIAADSTYYSAYRVRGTGSMTTTANLEYYIRPDLFESDDFTSGEVELAVFARCEMAATQTDNGATPASGGKSAVKCTLSAIPESGTSYGSIAYGSYGSTGKVLKAPNSATSFKPYYLGSIPFSFNKNNPTRHKLRLSFTNNASSTGVFGLDYLVIVPVRNIARSRTGSSDANVPDFTHGTTQHTKLITSDLVGSTFDYQTTSGARNNSWRDEGLGGEKIIINKDSARMVVLPSDQVVDLSDASDHSCAKNFTNSVQVSVQPQHYSFRQD